MLGRTHALTAFFLSLLLVWIFHLNHFFEIIGVITLTIFGSLFPDIDCVNSLLGRKVKLIGFLFKHRGFFHSIFALLFFYMLFYFLLGHIYALAFALGFFSHLLLDMMTVDGLYLFPFRKKMRGPIRVGGLSEKAFFILQLLLIVWLLTLLL